MERLVRRDDAVAAHIASIYSEFGLAFDPAFEDDLADVVDAYANGAFWVVEDGAGIVATAGVLANGPARVIKRSSRSSLFAVT